MIENILGLFPGKNRGVRFFIVLVACSAFFLPSHGFSQTVDRIVAVVNGKKIITQFDLNREMKPLLARFEGRELSSSEKKQVVGAERQLLNRMVNDYLLTAEAEALGLSVSQTEVANQINHIKQSNGLTDETLDEQLRLQDTTREKYEESMRQNMLRHRLLSLMVRRKVVVTDQEIQKYYEEHSKDYAQDKKVHLELLLLPVTENAVAIRKDLMDQKITFDQAIELYASKQAVSMCGDMGELDWNELSPDWKASLENLKAGDISTPFPLSGHNALLKLVRATSSEVQPLSEVRDEIYEHLSRPKFEKLYADYLTKLRNKAIIDIKL
jgi:peptidyl-prolyl cis-trans isomerase SurA